MAIVGTTYRALVVTVGMPNGIQIEAMACGFGPSSGTFAEHVPKALWAGCRTREATSDAYNGNRLFLEILAGHVCVFLWIADGYAVATSKPIAVYILSSWKVVNLMGS